MSKPKLASTASWEYSPVGTDPAPLIACNCQDSTLAASEKNLRTLHPSDQEPRMEFLCSTILAEKIGFFG